MVFFSTFLAVLRGASAEGLEPNRLILLRRSLSGTDELFAAMCPSVARRSFRDYPGAFFFPESAKKFACGRVCEKEPEVTPTCDSQKILQSPQNPGRSDLRRSGLAMGCAAISGCLLSLPITLVGQQPFAAENDESGNSNLRFPDSSSEPAEAGCRAITLSRRTAKNLEAFVYGRQIRLTGAGSWLRALPGQGFSTGKRILS